MHPLSGAEPKEKLEERILLPNFELLQSAPFLCLFYPFSNLIEAYILFIVNAPVIQ